MLILRFDDYFFLSISSFHLWYHQLLHSAPYFLFSQSLLSSLPKMQRKCLAPVLCTSCYRLLRHTPKQHPHSQSFCSLATLVKCGSVASEGYFWNPHVGTRKTKGDCHNELETIHLILEGKSNRNHGGLFTSVCLISFNYLRKSRLQVSTCSLTSLHA